MKNRYVCLILIMLSICFISINTEADIKDGSASVLFEDIGIVSDESIPLSGLDIKLINSCEYIGSDESVNFGNQLSNNSLDAYNALSTISLNKKLISFKLSNSIIFKTKSMKVTQEDLKEVSSQISVFTQMAVDAVSRDYPEFFWFDIPGSYFTYSWMYRSEGADGFYWTITNMSYNMKIDDEYDDILATCQTSYNTAVSAVNTNGNNTYEKLKSIHDYLCKTVSYYDGKYCFDSYGALVKRKAVCEGYAKAFKAICDRIDIPCILVSGKSISTSGDVSQHMWNAVRMDDNKWYYVDVTWDDSSGQLFYDYFLCGSDSKDTNFSKRPFKETHIPNGDFSLTGKYIFVYPQASQTAYDPKAIIISTPVPVITASPEPTSVPLPTNTPVPVENPNLGDSDRNGEITALDALLVLRCTARQIEGDSYNYLLKYGDADGNGRLGAVDALLILNIVAKL